MNRPSLGYALHYCTLVALLALAACGPGMNPGFDTGRTDATSDRVVVDTTRPDVVRPDAAPDAPRDVVAMDTMGSDAPVDVAVDSPVDTGPDTGPHPANASCAMATVISNGTTLMNQDPSQGVDSLAMRCRMPASGRVLYYRITLMPGTYARVTATPMGAWDPVVRVLNSCTASTCLSFADDTAVGGAESAIVQNTGTTSADYIVAVGSFSPTETGMFTLTAVVGMPQANASCAMATPVSGATTLMNQTIIGASDAPNAACTSHGLSTSPGKTVYYSVSVPAGTYFTASATLMGFDALMQILPACGATTCLASHDTFSTTAESITYSNLTAAPVTVILGVSSYSAPMMGTFDLAFTFAPVPYLETTLPTACDDMTGSTALGVTADTATSTIQMLPFTFTFFGTAQTYYSANSNGLAQLYPTMTGTASSSGGNSIIPTTLTPNNLIAPFWDDLAPPTGGGNNVNVKTFGSGTTRHFTIQWTGWARWLDTGTLLTFQAKLFETTNVIEFHYCTLTPSASGPASVTGNSATIGLENSTGMVGVQHSYNTAMSISTTNALHYTPAP